MAGTSPENANASQQPAEADDDTPASRSASTEAGSTEAAAPVAGSAESRVTPDAKSAFAAALERKKQAGQARSAHLDGHGGVGGATSSHKATRTFRRKSGSA